MWATSAQWREALAWSHDLTVGAAVTLAGDELATFVPESWSLTRRVAGSQIVDEVRLSAMDDESGALFNGDPGCPLRANGQRVSLTATLKAGAWEESIPLGVWPITDADPQGGAWRLYPNGRWARPSRLIDVTCGDLLDLVEEYGFFGLSVPPAGSTSATELARLVAGALPVSLDSTHTVASVPWEGSRIDAVRAIAADLDGVASVDRTGTLTVVDSAGTGDVIEVKPAPDQTVLSWGLALIDWQNGSHRGDVYNGVAMTGTADDGTTLYSRHTVETTGPARWSAAGFGRRLYTAHSPLLKTQSAVDAAALTRLATLQRERAQVLTVETMLDPSVDPLDTCRLLLPGADGPVDGLITEIRMSDAPTMTMQVSVPWEVRLDG